MPATRQPNRRNGPKLRKARRAAMHAQNGRCIYCQQPIWDERPDAFRQAFGLSERQASWFRCTAEHLVARCEGGQDSPDNIAAACHFCNVTRHLAKKPLDPAHYARRVRARLAAGGWHGLRATEPAGPGPSARDTEKPRAPCGRP